MFVTDEMIREMEERFGVPDDRLFRLPADYFELARIASSQKFGRNHDVTLYVQMGQKWIVIAKHAYPEGLFRSPSGGLHPGEDFITGINREVAEELGCRIRIERFLLKTTVDFFLHPSLMSLAEPPPGSIRLLYGPAFDVELLKRRRRISIHRMPDEESEQDEKREPTKPTPLQEPAESNEELEVQLPIPEFIKWRSWVFLATYLDGDFNYTDNDEIREVKVVDWEQFAEYGKIMRMTDSAGLHYRAKLHEAVAEILGKP